MSMAYKGYLAEPIEFEPDVPLFHGQILGLQDVITFQGRDAAELKQAFEDSVDDYLEFCGDLGREPERS